MNELFEIKNVPNVLNEYSITKDGRVYGHQRQRWLKGTLNSVGYQMYSLKLTNGLFKWFTAHKLVAYTFELKKNKSEQKEINHIDGNKLNNHISNLEYVTHSENVFKSYVTGRKSILGTKRHPINEDTRNKMINAKNKRVKVFIDGVFYKQFERINDCCTELQINRSTINRIIQNKIKKTKYFFKIIPDEK